jgi:hypothetical protein
MHFNRHGRVDPASVGALLSVANAARELQLAMVKTGLSADYHVGLWADWPATYVSHGSTMLIFEALDLGDGAASISEGGSCSAFEEISRQRGR